MLARATRPPPDGTPRAPAFEDLYQAIEALPQGITGEILEPGTIRAMGRPGSNHRHTARALPRSLRRYDGEEGGCGWWFEVEAEIRLPNDRLVVPDLAGWRGEGVRPSFLRGNPIRVVPAWVCEILSPSTGPDDRRLKLPLYADQGTAWIWLADPEARTVEVFETREQMPVLVRQAKDADRVLLPPFDAELDLAAWWPPAPAEESAAG